MSAKLYQIENAADVYSSIYLKGRKWLTGYNELPPDMLKRMERKTKAYESSTPAKGWKNSRYMKRAEDSHTESKRLLYLLQNPLDLDEWFFMEAARCLGGSKQDYIHKMFIGQVK